MIGLVTRQRAAKIVKGILLLVVMIGLNSCFVGYSTATLEDGKTLAKGEAEVTCGGPLDLRYQMGITDHDEVGFSCWSINFPFQAFRHESPNDFGVRLHWKHNFLDKTSLNAFSIIASGSFYKAHVIDGYGDDPLLGSLKMNYTGSNGVLGFIYSHRFARVEPPTEQRLQFLPYWRDFFPSTFYMGIKVNGLLSDISWTDFEDIPASTAFRTQVIPTPIGGFKFGRHRLQSFVELSFLLLLNRETLRFEVAPGYGMGLSYSFDLFKAKSITAG